MAKRKQLCLHLNEEVTELFERCHSHIVEAKRSAGLDTTTSVAEVLKHAMHCLDEKHSITRPARPGKRAV